MTFRTFFNIFIAAAWVVVVACTSYNVKSNMTTEERFALAKRMFENEDYLDAKTQFKIIVLNNSGAAFTDEAQFLLAESHFHLKEYILAADEYARLTRLYPQSEWLDDAQFKIGLSHYEQSPKASLDQKYTRLAIESFQLFLEDYPESELAPEAERLLQISRSKLAKKEFKNGQLYRKLGDCEAALVYFTSVIENYYDTKYITSALFERGECLMERRRPVEAQAVFTELITKYPDSDYVSDATDYLEEIDENLLRIQEANGVSQKDKNK